MASFILGFAAAFVVITALGWWMDRYGIDE